jgi:peptide/nickel transport system substrate-binding protein
VLALCVLVAASAQPQAPSKYGGTLVVGVIGVDADTLDPTTSRTPLAVTSYLTFCQRLYSRDLEQRLVPLLASRLPVLSKDKLSYTVPLRRDVKFNDGTPMNAQAVVMSVERLMTHPLSSRKSDFESVESVTAPGPYTVVFHLKARDSAFQGNPWVFSPAQLAKVGEGFGASPVCAGPFMFDHRVPGDRITVVKSPFYFDQKNVFLDKIVYRPMGSAAGAVAALKAGDIQALDQVSSTELPGVRTDTGLRVLQGPQLGWLGVIINIGNKNGAGKPPYSNVGTPLASSAKLRQAFEEAIDRHTLNKILFGGLFQPSCTEIAPANAAWFDATKITCTPYDPKHARKLVAESGFPNPTVRLLVSNTQERLKLAEFIQAQEKEVGIDVVIEPSDAPDARALSGNFDAAILGWIPGGPDPHGNIFQFVASSGVRNYSGYSSPRLDFVLGNGQKATDVKARSTNYRVAQQIIASDRPIIPLYNPVTYSAFSADLAGMRLTNSGALYFVNARYTSA